MRFVLVRSLILTCLALAFLAVPLMAAAPAAVPAKIDSHTLLPDDTEAVVAINLKQLLGTDLIKKIDTKGANTDKVKEELGFDPAKDIESVVFAIPGGGNAEKTIVILNGTFDPAKFEGKIEEAAKAKADNVKVHSVVEGKENFKVFEVTKLEDLMKGLPPQFAPPGGANPLEGKSIFAGFANTAVIIAGNKDQIVQALMKASGSKKTELKSKEMKNLLTKIDSKRTLSLAILATCIGKEAIDKFESITGGITVGAEIQTEIFLNTKDAAAAKTLNMVVDQGLEQVNGILGFITTQQKELAPLVDVVKAIKATTKDSTVTIKSTIDADSMKKIGEGIQEAAKKQLQGGGIPGGN